MEEKKQPPKMPRNTSTWSIIHVRKDDKILLSSYNANASRVQEFLLGLLEIAGEEIEKEPEYKNYNHNLLHIRKLGLGNNSIIIQIKSLFKEWESNFLERLRASTSQEKLVKRELDECEEVIKEVEALRKSSTILKLFTGSELLERGEYPTNKELFKFISLHSKGINNFRLLEITDILFQTKLVLQAGEIIMQIIEECNAFLKLKNLKLLQDVFTEGNKVVSDFDFQFPEIISAANYQSKEHLLTSLPSKEPVPEAPETYNAGGDFRIKWLGSAAEFGGIINALHSAGYIELPENTTDKEALLKENFLIRSLKGRGEIKELRHYLGKLEKSWPNGQLKIPSAEGTNKRGKK